MRAEIPILSPLVTADFDDSLLVSKSSDVSTLRCYRDLVRSVGFCFILEFLVEALASITDIRYLLRTQKGEEDV